MASVETVSFKKIKRKRRTSKADIAFNIFLGVFFALFMIVTLYPIINTLAYSFNDRFDVIENGPIHTIPHAWTLENYDYAITNVNLRNGLTTTAARTLIGTVTGLVSTAVLAFLLSRRKFIFRYKLALFWVIAFYAQAGLLPTWVMYRKFGFAGSFWVYIIPNLVNIIYVMVIRTYMQSIPESIEDAATLDGAGYMRLFWRVVMPMCRPVLAAVAFFIASYHWNAWFDALMYNKFTPEYTTLQYEIMKLYSYSEGPRTVRSAWIILSMLPVLIVYPFFQKYFITGIHVGRVKA